VPSYCLRKATTRYRYYRCSRAQQRGAHSCPSKPVSAGSIEQLVLDQIRALVSDPARLREMAQAAGPVETLAEPSQVRRILDPGWEELAATERAAILRDLVKRVEYDGANDQVAITFHAWGIAALAAGEEHP